MMDTVLVSCQPPPQNAQSRQGHDWRKKPETEHEAHEYFLPQPHMQCPQCGQWEYNNRHVKDHVYADGCALLALKWPAVSQGGIPRCFDGCAVGHDY